MLYYNIQKGDVTTKSIHFYEMFYECLHYTYAETDAKHCKCLHILQQINAGINKKYHSELYITVKTQQSCRKIFLQHMDVSVTY